VHLPMENLQKSRRAMSETLSDCETRRKFNLPLMQQNPKPRYGD
jgi:hypothetical protein